MNRLRKTSFHINDYYLRSTQHIPSAPIAPFNPAAEGKAVAPEYTGTDIIGIATMHKSNPVPVTAAFGTNPKITD